MRSHKSPRRRGKREPAQVPRTRRRRSLGAGLGLFGLIVATVACDSVGHHPMLEPIAECEEYVAVYSRCLANLGATVADLEGRAERTRAALRAAAKGTDEQREKARAGCESAIHRLTASCR